ncbi:hypothetical protein BDR26DRAFT_849475, partial [Obelidium mucronatum]
MSQPKGKQQQLQCPICTTATVKYKCPACKTPYCSVSCFKLHKDSNCALGAPKPNAAGNKKSGQQNQSKREQSNQDLDAEEAELKLSDEQLQKLATNETLQNLFQTNPSLIKLLTTINNSANPESLIDTCINGEPSFSGICKRECQDSGWRRAI